jgi:hypothetical protein
MLDHHHLISVRGVQVRRVGNSRLIGSWRKGGNGNEDHRLPRDTPERFPLSGKGKEYDG